MVDYSDFTKENIIRRKTAIESGYVNNKADLGGETNWGITIATAREYGYTGAMKDLPKQTAFDIYDKLWWQRLRLDEIVKFQPFLADRLFDFSINAGRKNAMIALQRILNSLNYMEQFWPDLVVDGAIGDKTINAIKSLQAKRGAEGMAILAMTLTHFQTYYYLDISEKRKQNETFTYGWFRRVYTEVLEYAKAVVG